MANKTLQAVQHVFGFACPLTGCNEYDHWKLWEAIKGQCNWSVCYHITWGRSFSAFCAHVVFFLPCTLFLPLCRLSHPLLIDWSPSMSDAFSHFPCLYLPSTYLPISLSRTERCCPQPSRCCRIVGPKSSCCACRLLKWLRPERESARPQKQTVSTDNQGLFISSTLRCSLP